MDKKPLPSSESKTKVIFSFNHYLFAVLETNERVLLSSKWFF